MRELPVGVLTEECPACGAPVFWGKTEGNAAGKGGAKVMLDAAVRCITLTIDAEKRPLYDIAEKGGPPYIYPGLSPWSVHADTCASRKTS